MPQRMTLEAEELSPVAEPVELEKPREGTMGRGVAVLFILLLFVLLFSFLPACAERLGDRWGSTGGPGITIPEGIKLWAGEVSLGFSSELQFERNPDWGSLAAKVTPHDVDTFVGIGLASVSDDLGIPVDTWTQDYVVVNSGAGPTGTPEMVIFRQTEDSMRSECSGPVSDFLERPSNKPFVKFHYCSPRSAVYSGSADIPPLARELIEIDSEYGPSSAYVFTFDVTGRTWPDVQDSTRLKFDISVFVRIEAKGVRADKDRFTTVEGFNHSKLRAFRTNFARRVLSAYVAEWERRGVKVTFDDSKL